MALTATHLGANAYLALFYLERDNMPKALEQMQVLRSVCGISGCEELIAVESAINRARKGIAPAAGKSPAPAATRGEIPREVE